MIEHLGKNVSSKIFNRKIIRQKLTARTVFMCCSSKHKSNLRQSFTRKKTVNLVCNINSFHHFEGEIRSKFGLKTHRNQFQIGCANKNNTFTGFQPAYFSIRIEKSHGKRPQLTGIWTSKLPQVCKSNSPRIFM